MRIIDADGHVAENPTLAMEMLKRWPEHVAVSGGERPRLVIEGRRYPEDQGPGAGCPVEHGITKATGLNCATPEGMLGDADRDQLDTMVSIPASACARRAWKTLRSLPDSRGSTTSGSPTSVHRPTVGCGGWA